MYKLLRISTVPHSLDLLLKGQLKYMGENGFKVYISCSYGKEIENVITRENVSYYPLPLTRTLNPLKDIYALYKAVRLIRKIKPDIVHTHSPKAGTIGMIAAWICRVPIRIHTVAGLPLLETNGIKRKLLLAVEKLTYACANWVLPNSGELKKIILENNLIKETKKVQVIGKGGSNGIDLDYYRIDEGLVLENEQFRNAYSISNSHIVLSFVGRLANYKGVNELIRAFSKLIEEFSNIKLLLVGPIENLNPLKPDVLQQIHNNTEIISVGFQEDIRKYLMISDIFIFPSYREGFPQSLMQALAFGLPCIASNINGCNELIEDMESGILIEPKNDLEIINACRFLINNPEKRKEFGCKGKINVAEHYEQKKFWHLLRNFYVEKLTRNG